MLSLHIQKILHTVEGDQMLEVSLELAAGKTLAVYGNSGVGKTTLLRLIAGLSTPHEGTIQWREETWLNTATRIDRPAQLRSAAMVFQDYALFPNMTVQQNVAFAQDPKHRNLALVLELMDALGIAGLADRLPARLSGGQQQRVALARALARKPELLLLDEPLSALDHVMRLDLQRKLMELRAKMGLTMVLVSHDLAEIYRLADHVIVIESGKIQQQGTPQAVFGGDKPNLGLEIIAQVISWSPNCLSLLADGRIQQFDIATAKMEPGTRIVLHVQANGIRIEVLG